MDQTYVFLSPVGDYVWIMFVKADSKEDALTKMLRGEWKPHSYFRGATLSGGIELLTSTLSNQALQKYLTH